MVRVEKGSRRTSRAKWRVIEDEHSAVRLYVISIGSLSFLVRDQLRSRYHLVSRL